jgi:hypothetical protein
MKGSFGSLDESHKKSQCTDKNYSLSIAQNLSIAVVKRVNDRNNLRILCQPLLLLFRNKRPELVDVDDRPPFCVTGQVVSAHTHFTKVTRVVLVEVRAVYRKRKRLRGHFPMSPSILNARLRTGGGAYHQRDHDLRDVYGAFQHVRDRPRRGHGACESSRGGSAFSEKVNKILISTRSHACIRSVSKPSSSISASFASKICSTTRHARWDRLSDDKDIEKRAWTDLEGGCRYGYASVDEDNDKLYRSLNSHPCATPPSLRQASYSTTIDFNTRLQLPGEKSVRYIFV